MNQNYSQKRNRGDNDSDDDYMADSLLVDVPIDQTYERKRIRALNEQIQASYTKPKAIARQEELDQALSKTIPSSNKGFQMLQKMGFKPTADMAEPVKVELKMDKQGLGSKDPLHRYVSVKEQKKAQEKAEVKKLGFIDHRAKKFNVSVYTNALKKMRIEIMGLDENNGVKEHALWPNVKNAKIRSIDGYADLPKHAQDFDFDELDLEDKVLLANTYLRTQYYYCTWCADKFKNEEEMNEYCPGEERDMHDL